MVTPGDTTQSRRTAQLSPADPQTCRGKGVVFKPINLDWFVMQQVIFLTKEAFTLVLCDMFYFTSFQFLKILIDPLTQVYLVAQWLRICLAVQGHPFHPWSGKVPHAPGWLSPCATTTEPMCLSPGTATTEPVCRNY